MGDDPRPLEELADAVLEGKSVDWNTAASATDMPRRAAVAELRVLAGIAELHRAIASESAENPPDHWGRLRILEHIGRGSFGDVYRAWDTKLDREVALKLVRPGAEGTGAEVLREARLLARVRHPNVATVYDADEIDGRVGLWMEFVHGKNLEQVLRERTRLTEREVVAIGIELCRALAAVHDVELLHRDVKAQNVMQAEDGRLVLMDFGTGSDLEKASAAEDAAGTPLYLAPEIFRGEQATVRSDIYSAGVVLFHLLTGSYPVAGANVEELGGAHASGQRLTLETKSPRVSGPLASAVERAIDDDPLRRFGSARELLGALEHVRRRAAARRRMPYWLAAAAVSLVAVALVVAASARGFYPGLTPQKRAVKTPPAMSEGAPSPDGRFRPYSQIDTGNLAVYEFATGESRVLTHSADVDNGNFASGSVMSADGGRIAYSWEDSSCECTQLRVIDTDGRGERVLYGGRGAAEIVPREWSSDGQWILGARRRSPDDAEAVLVSANDGALRALSRPAHAFGRISLSPDGRYVAYDQAESSSGPDRGIYLSAISGDTETPVVTGPTFDSDPMWTLDGSGLVFVSRRTGGPGLWLQRIKDGVPDGRPRLLDREMGPFAPLTLTKSGSLFYSHGTGLMDVYTAPIDPATGELVGEPANPATHVQGSNIAADWSPDGETLAFASWRTARRNILVLHSMRTGLERELELDVVANGVHWSPDGRSIAVGGPDRRGVRALRLIDPESGKIGFTVPVDGNASAMAWDLDGQHVYLVRDLDRITRSEVSTGKEETLYRPLPDSTMGRLAVSPDGRWIAFTCASRPAKSQRLSVIPSGGGPARDLVEVPGGMLGVGAWTRDGRRILFTQTTADENHKHQGELWSVPFEGGPPRRLGLAMRALRDVRVSPDGTRIAFTSGYPESDLWVFENFLPGRTP